jgi:hypothetical protein
VGTVTPRVYKQNVVDYGRKLVEGDSSLIYLRPEESVIHGEEEEEATAPSV